MKLCGQWNCTIRQLNVVFMPLCGIVLPKKLHYRLYFDLSYFMALISPEAWKCDFFVRHNGHEKHKANTNNQIENAWYRIVNLLSWKTQSQYQQSKPTTHYKQSQCTVLNLESFVMKNTKSIPTIKTQTQRQGPAHQPCKRACARAVSKGLRTSRVKGPAHQPC